MNSFSNDNETGRLSLSLQSYGSDEELPDYSLSDDNSEDPCSKASNTIQASQAVTNVHLDRPELIAEDEYVMNIATRLGLTGVSKESLEELFSSFEVMRSAQRKHTQAQIILGAINETVSTNSKLPTQVRLHVDQVREHISLMDYVVPTASCEAPEKNGVLGVTEDILNQASSMELPPSDIKALKVAVESQLSLKLSHLSEADRRAKCMISKVSELRTNDQTDLVEPRHTLQILDLKKELDQEIALHESLLIRLDGVLGNLAELKRNVFPSAANEICSNLEHKSLLLIQQLKALNLEIVKENYTEDPTLTDAYKELRKQLNSALDECKTKLSNLKDKEARYMKLKGTEYDNLLKQYKSLKKELDQKKYALENLM